LREAFAPYGEISDVKIMKDPHTLVHKGYGFISFVNKVEAESAIAQMNGQWLGTRKIRTNWATRKIQPGGAEMQAVTMSSNKYANKLDYNEVWSRSSDTNTTVYCGGLNNISEDVIRNTFSMYGQIVGIHPFPDRGYAFVRFASKEAACNAICGVHGMEINGGVAKCSWGTPTNRLGIFYYMLFFFDYSKIVLKIYSFLRDCMILKGVYCRIIAINLYLEVKIIKYN
jgi:nucleolysin TIA-1/TIAR